MGKRYCISLILMGVLILCITAPAFAQPQNAKTAPPARHAIVKHSPAKTTISIRFGNAPYHRAFYEAKQVWNRGAGVELVRGNRWPDAIVTTICRHGSLLGYHDPRLRRPDVIAINRCTPMDEWQRRQVYTHELGHLLGLPHMAGHTIMTVDSSNSAGWRPTQEDKRRVNNMW
jgi:hypothetical protein